MGNNVAFWLFMTGAGVAGTATLAIWFTGKTLVPRLRIRRLQWFGSIILFGIEEGLVCALMPTRAWLGGGLVIGFVCLWFYWVIPFLRMAMRPPGR